MNEIEKIHNLFLEEAYKSPMLLNDLANMERYIAESYSGRSLIELLQNADDACANSFLIKKVSNNSFVVANDGREFNIEDLNALCRSGASTKKRKGTTIGYRGIGFKSVVNYASNVHLYSGDIKVSFSKKETSKLLPDSKVVPLIRVPHLFCGNKYIDEIKKILQEGYTTVFVFEVNNSCLEKEIEVFDEKCMLFLRKIQEIHFELNDIKKSYKISRNIIENECENVKYIGSANNTEWKIFCDVKNKDVKIAFKVADNKIINANPEEAVIHSFMPTNDRIGIPIKVNGDFSTDPSRTKIVFDDETENTINKCINLLGRLLEKTLTKGIDEEGIIQVFCQARLDPLREIKGKSISDIIIEKFIEQARKILIKYFSINQKLYLQAEWISEADFTTICNNICSGGIGQQLDSKFPGIVKLAEILGIEKLHLNDCLMAMKNIELSKETRIKVLADVIKRSRIGLEKDRLNLLNDAYIVEFTDGAGKITEYNKEKNVEESFLESIIEEVGNLIDVERFLKNLGIKYKNKQKVDVKNDNKMVEIQVNKTRIVGSNATVKKWRSVEENVTEILKKREDVAQAIDVAAKNMGYDIEVVLKDGVHQYYEVKSVDSMGMAFSMTNNEFSSAVQYKEQYYLAVVHQDNRHIEICYICNPINTLNMTKRVTRWEWYCSYYNGCFEEYKIN